MATNRTIDASEATVYGAEEKTYMDVFKETWPQFPAGLQPDYTYMFEL